jgi:predicted dehydrogenase
MTKALIVGMGIGNLYHSVFSSLGYEIDTVDSNPEKNATFKTADDIVSDYGIAVICTPNFTHELVARTIAKKCKIVLVEKPGVQDSKCWSCLVEDFPDTRFMMVKNNQYRDEIKLFKSQSEQSERVYVRWNNANRIPQPGSWFTTKALAFGGVSRDLIPHMLSYYCTLTDFKNGNKLDAISMQNYLLSDITSTDYGTVNPDGVYDVDDFCKLEFKNGNTHWVLTANWKTNLDHDDSSISFSMKNSAVRHQLGLCPESAYQTMVETAVKNLNNNEFWKKQFAQDMWIHEQIEKL